MSRRLQKVFLLLPLLALAPVQAGAQPEAAEPERAPAPTPDAPAPIEAVSEAAEDVTLAKRLGYRVAVDGPITALTWGYWFGTEALKPSLGPTTCRLCGVNGLDWSVRNALVWQDTGLARLTSDVMLFGIAPLAALATTLTLAKLDGRMEEALWDVMLIIEAVGISSAMTQTVKFLVGRERPFSHVLSAEEKLAHNEGGDSFMSFFSGHASATFALAAAAGTVARMRGRTYAVWAWAVGLPIATVTAYLRIAGDKHYLTDVATGALIGTAVGILVPAVHDWGAFREGGKGRTATVGVVPVPGGAAATFAARW